MKYLLAVVLTALALCCGNGYATNYFTEQFYYDFDLNGLSLTFTPDGSPDFYSVSATNITALPDADLSGAAELSMSDDTVYRYFIKDDEVVYLYGVSYIAMRITSNGFITFNDTTGDWSPSLREHFAYRRIALFWADLNPRYGGTISVMTKATKVVLTYENVPFYSDLSRVCNAQLEMFFDGRIRMSWVDCDIRYNTIVGLSEGLGDGLSTPEDFTETDLSEIGFDYDMDGLPDAWEIHHFLGTEWCLPDDDSWDGDGYDNMAEYIAGTDPLDATSYFCAGCEPDDSLINISWDSMEGRKYRIWYKNALDNGDFTPLSSYLYYPQTNYVINTAGDQRFYKVTVELE